MNLNALQRKILLVGIAVIVLMGICPPWKHTFKYKSINSEEPAGYGLIVYPPSAEGYGPAGYGIKIDFSRLLIQWAVTAAVTGGGVLLTAKQKDAQD